MRVTLVGDLSRTECLALGPFCGSKSVFSLVRNPPELDSVGEFTEIEGQKQSSTW